MGSSNASFVTDDIADRFCVLGSAEEHVAKLRALAKAGVDQFNLYLMNGDEEEQLELYGSQVIPALRDVAASPRLTPDRMASVRPRIRRRMHVIRLDRRRSIHRPRSSLSPPRLSSGA